MEMEAALRGAERLAPPSSKRKTRLPYTPDFITKLCSHLSLSDPFDAAVFACLATCFYAAARVGEFVVPRLDAFSPASHVTTANLRVDRNPDGLEVTVLHLPHTKAAPLEGEDMYWGSHPGPTDPYEALRNHLQVNNLPPNAHLFAYHHKNQFQPSQSQPSSRDLPLLLGRQVWNHCKVTEYASVPPYSTCSWAYQ